MPFQNENTKGVQALCLQPLDLAASKLVAGRPKDLDFVTAMCRHELIDAASLSARIATFSESAHREAAVRHAQVVAARSKGPAPGLAPRERADVPKPKLRP